MGKIHKLGMALLCSGYQASGGSEFSTDELPLVDCDECRERVLRAEISGRWRVAG